MFYLRSICFALLVAGMLAPRLHAENELDKSYETFAQSIKTFSADDFLYGFRKECNEYPFREAGHIEAIQAFSKFISDRNAPTVQIAALLRHDYPKVRTLAAVALFDREDPQLLPLLLPLLEDAAKTFPATMPISRIPGMNEPDPTRDQSVGEVVNAIFTVYLQPAGFNYGPKGLHDNPGFEEYWRLRSKRTWCASWFTAKLARASFGSSPTREWRKESIRKIRQQIDAIPQPERAWILLWLSRDPGADALVTEDELVAMLRGIDRESLLKVLGRAIPSDDPDLQARKSGNYGYGRICLFILKHAQELLKAEDAAALLKQELFERNYRNNGISDPMINPAWAMAAARLKPAEAREILSSAHTRFNGEYDGTHRLNIAEAYWEWVGESDSAIVADWFYAEVKYPPSGSHEISNFIKAIHRQKRDSRPLIAAIVNDARFDALNWKSVEAVAHVVNTYLPEKVVPPEQFEQARNPMGLDLFARDIPAAMKTYPKETQTLLDQIAEWRRAIRASLPKWAPGK